MWVAEEEGANTLSGNHIRNAISVSFLLSLTLMHYVAPPPSSSLHFLADVEKFTQQWKYLIIN